MRTRTLESTDFFWPAGVSRNKLLAMHTPPPLDSVVRLCQADLSVSERLRTAVFCLHVDLRVIFYYTVF